MSGRLLARMRDPAIKNGWREIRWRRHHEITCSCGSVTSTRGLALPLVDDPDPLTCRHLRRLLAGKFILAHSGQKRAPESERRAVDATQLARVELTELGREKFVPILVARALIES